MIENKEQLDEGENNKDVKRLPIYINHELQSLIRELMLPRIEMLTKIVGTRFVTQAKNADDQEAGEDWWPDYKICSDKHFMTDMNGLVHLMQSSLKELSEELTTIGGKFQTFISDNIKPRNSGGEQDGQNGADGQMDHLARYLLVRSLIKDLDKFVNCCNRQCSKCLKERREHADRAMATKETGDRVRLKVFDERNFNKLLGRIDSLKSFLQNFCALFEDKCTVEEKEANSPPQAKTDEIAS